jgi:hypothetical protein
MLFVLEAHFTEGGDMASNFGHQSTQQIPITPGSPEVLNTNVAYELKGGRF